MNEMEYHINLGAWRSVFALPCELVDKHLKLAGAAQLKVILWVLRHSGEGFTTADIAGALTMQEADVRDCMQYWVQTGLIAMEDNVITPALPVEPVQAVPMQLQQTVPVPTPEPVTEVPEKKRPLTRPGKPDMNYMNLRISEDSDVAFLMQSAEEILGRITSPNDKAVLLTIHEYDGLPVEVILMLLQYAFNIGKGNMRYIEKMAINWAEDEITTLSAAEAKIRQLTSGRDAANKVQCIIGAEQHSPTEKESVIADRWINQWHFSGEMIRAAYEVCVDAKGKYIPKYTNSILERWHNAGITTPEQVKQEKQNRKKTKKQDGYEATYDISEYESTSVTDGEW